MDFTTELLATGGTTTGFVVPDEWSSALGAGRRPKVVVTVDGHTWRTSIASMGGRFLLGASAAVREASGIAPGRPTRWPSRSTARRAPSTCPTTSPPPWPPPPAAGAAWAGLTYSQQRQHAEAVLAAKKPETRERRVAGIVEHAPMTTIEAVRGDITTQHVDAIVNAANSTLLGGGGVDGAIHAAAGPALLEQCRELRRTTHPGGLDVGDAVATGAGDLPCRWVVHTVGPNRHRGQTDPALLASCFASSLAVARGLGARSIAFPAVSAGVYGWDVDEVARVAVRTVRSECAAHDGIDLVRFVLVGDRVAGGLRDGAGRPPADTRRRPRPRGSGAPRCGAGGGSEPAVAADAGEDGPLGGGLPAARRVDHHPVAGVDADVPGRGPEEDQVARLAGC